MKRCPVCGPDTGSIKKQYGKEYCCNPNRHHGIYYGLAEGESAEAKRDLGIGMAICEGLTKGLSSGNDGS